jgi:hypothetical protein
MLYLIKASHIRHDFTIELSLQAMDEPFHPLPNVSYFSRFSLICMTLFGQLPSFQAQAARKYELFIKKNSFFLQPELVFFHFFSKVT